MNTYDKAAIAKAAAPMTIDVKKGVQIVCTLTASEDGKSSPFVTKDELANALRDAAYNLDGRVTHHLTIEEANTKYWHKARRHAYKIAVGMRTYNLANGMKLVNEEDAKAWTPGITGPKRKGGTE